MSDSPRPAGASAAAASRRACEAARSARALADGRVRLPPVRCCSSPCWRCCSTPSRCWSRRSSRRPDTDFGGVLFTVAIYVLVALGLNIVVGYAGLLDLGYVGFYAVGAYTVGVLTSEHASWPLSCWRLPIAVVVTMISGVLLGAPTLRVRGDYLAIVTLGLRRDHPADRRQLRVAGRGRGHHPHPPAAGPRSSSRSRTSTGTAARRSSTSTTPRRSSSSASSTRSPTTGWR